MALLDSVLGLDPFFSEFDRVTERLFGTAEATRAGAAMPMEVLRRGDEMLVRIDLPGVTTDAVDVSVDGRTLTVQATRQAHEEAGDVYYVRGPLYGTMRRQLTLPDVVDVDRIEAHFDHGVLTLRVPVAEHAKPRRIEIRRPQEAKEISAG
jgi:HSP20 family protein